MSLAAFVALSVMSVMAFAVVVVAAVRGTVSDGTLKAESYSVLAVLFGAAVACRRLLMSLTIDPLTISLIPDHVTDP